MLGRRGHREQDGHGMRQAGGDVNRGHAWHGGERQAGSGEQRERFGAAGEHADGAQVLEQGQVSARREARATGQVPVHVQYRGWRIYRVAYAVAQRAEVCNKTFGLTELFSVKEFKS